MRMLEDVIIKPVISEASMDLIGQNKYVFKVAKDADKFEIAAAVEKMFPGTVVESVKRYGVHFGYTSAWKKAIVTLTKDSKTIEFFEGMN